MRRQAGRFTVVSLFAGIGGFDLGLERAGFTVVAQVECDPFCQRVLETRWPGVWRGSDVRSFQLAERGRRADECRETDVTGFPSTCDLLCGGFPCQDLSVAGKRVGLAGARSGLFWEIIRIAKELRPPFLLLENVPGLLSSNEGKDINTVLDALYELGYIVEIDEVDSQYFGVAQRRRRLFFCGIDASIGLLGKTHFSSAMRCSFLTQSLLDALESLSKPLPTDADGTDCSSSIAAHGLLRKIRCCEVSLGRSAWLNWLSDYAGQLQPSATEPRNSAYPRDENGSRDALDTAALAVEASFVGNISKLWRELWGDLSENPKVSTISTWSKQTTDLKICICAEISLLIYWHTVALKPSSPFCLNAVSSALTAVLESIALTEQVAHDLFAEATWRDRAWLFLGKADKIIKHAERHFTAASVEAVLFEPESGSRDSPTSSEARTELAASLRSRTASPGVNSPGRGGEDDMNLVFATLNSGGNSGGFRTEPGEHLVAAALEHQSGQRNNPSHQTFVTHSLSAEGHDASEDGTGRGMPIVFTERTRAQGRTFEAQEDQAYALTNPGSGGRTHSRQLYDGMGVRRLTPTECERLQSFPDGWTCLCQPLESYDPSACTCPDGPRYRALGNAVTVNVVHWIGKRLKTMGAA